MWTFTLEGAALSFEESTYFADSAGPRRALQIVARGATFGASEIRWVAETQGLIQPLEGHSRPTAMKEKNPKIRRALLSVSDKSNLDVLARALSRMERRAHIHRRHVGDAQGHGLSRPRTWRISPAFRK